MGRSIFLIQLKFWFACTDSWRPKSCIFNEGRGQLALSSTKNIPAHFIRERKTKGYDIIGVNVFHFKLMIFHFKRDA